MTELARVAHTFEVPEDFIKWLGEQGLKKPEDLAMVTSDEGKVEEKLVDASGVTFNRMIERISVAKLWLHCRQQLERSSAMRSGKISDNLEDKLDDTICTDLETMWLTRYNFRLQGARLLTDTLLSRRYKELSSSPRRLTILLPENARTMSSVERRGSAAMATTMVDAEFVSGHDELWTRIRADCTSMCYVTIADPAFFPYEDLEKFCDRIRGYIFQRFKGVFAPLEFYKEAYNKTMQLFVEGIRVELRTLKALVNDTSAYHSFWTVYTPPQAGIAPAGSHSGGGGGGGGGGVTTGATADVCKELQSEVEHLKKAMRSQQSTFDRRWQREHPGGRKRRPEEQSQGSGSKWGKTKGSWGGRKDGDRRPQ